MNYPEDLSASDALSVDLGLWTTHQNKIIYKSNHPADDDAPCAYCMGRFDGIVWDEDDLGWRTNGYTAETILELTDRAGSPIDPRNDNITYLMTHPD